MKARAERMAEGATKELLETINNRIDSTKEIVNAMDETHSVEELVGNNNYCALVSALCSLYQARDCMSCWLNFKTNTTKN